MGIFGTTPPRRHPRDIIEAVVANMRRNLERLKYSTLAPSRYTVYLHPAEFERLETIVPVLHEQTIRALDEELQRINARPPARRWLRRIAREPDTQVRNAATDWHVTFLADPDDELKQGDILVDSELLMPARPDLGVGEQTRKIATVQSRQGSTTIERTLCRSSPSSPPPLGRIEYDDESGHHFYDVTKDCVTIGRGGIAHPVDLRIVSSTDVSREHARIRRDLASDRFFLIDLSTLGTTLNGRHVPKGFDDADGTRRQNGPETPLPDVATIGLAGAIFLDFRKRR
ncbi:MAG TPA: FhaA domain-containing protein [Vicinamibacterales bacterium]|nr:FhaA domain-containing protein [Vicinamibacterales bacterium]